MELAGRGPVWYVGFSASRPGVAVAQLGVLYRTEGFRHFRHSPFFGDLERVRRCVHDPLLWFGSGVSRRNASVAHFFENRAELRGAGGQSRAPGHHYPERTIGRHGGDRRALPPGGCWQQLLEWVSRTPARRSLRRATDPHELAAAGITSDLAPTHRRRIRLLCHC